ncbi:hypothetical protein CPT_Metamorpho_127 [Klebsiella phage Metamorpho]|nr:hypothetical protein CPT_Metamorpho_127 [Klebsiella phage Metamorpho]
MTTEQMQVQVDTLKVRIFDLSETLSQVEASRTQYGEALSAIAEAVGLTANEQGAVSLEDIVGAVRALTSVTDGDVVAEDAEA